MSKVSPNIQDLAQRLLALEMTRGVPSENQADEAINVCEKLRVLISRLVGSAGFASLLSRALALARVSVPSLAVVKVRADGSLEGFDEVERDQDTGAGGNGGVVLVANLLELLVTFIGLSLTLSLLSDVWPDATWNETDSGTGDMS
jgi:hypothetical protein